MFPITYIVTPIVGAAIGYLTNDLAVKMLFHPYKPVFLFGKQLPFTPGLVARNKDRMAESIARTISAKLMTEDIMRSNLLSDEVMEKLDNTINGFVCKLSNDETPIAEKLTAFFSEEDVENYKVKIKEKISGIVAGKLSEAKMGKKLAALAIENFKENSESIIRLGITMFEPVLHQKITAAIDNVIDSQAQPISEGLIGNALNDFLAKPLNSLISGNEEHIATIKQTIIRIYKNTITEQLPKILETINLEKMVENKIKEMDIKEMEELIFGIMKKELKGIVNLGAIIGFLMGFLTIGINNLIEWLNTMCN